MLLRIALLFSLSWIIRLTAPLMTVLGQAISDRDLILLGGGAFLIGKSTYEIHEKLEGEEGHASARIPPAFLGVLIQILLLDLVFSLDSVITAVGMTDKFGVMIAAVVPVLDAAQCERLQPILHQAPRLWGALSHTEE
jgi:predicted tellurium resistance membrane protein TerC